VKEAVQSVVSAPGSISAGPRARLELTRGSTRHIPNVVSGAGRMRVLSR